LPKLPAISAPAASKASPIALKASGPYICKAFLLGEISGFRQAPSQTLPAQRSQPSDRDMRLSPSMGAAACAVAAV
jgi:hypothetical protein